MNGRYASNAEASLAPKRAPARTNLSWLRQYCEQLFKHPAARSKTLALPRVTLAPLPRKVLLERDEYPVAIDEWRAAGRRRKRRQTRVCHVSQTRYQDQGRLSSGTGRAEIDLSYHGQATSTARIDEKTDPRGSRAIQPQLPHGTSACVPFSTSRIFTCFSEFSKR